MKQRKIKVACIGDSITAGYGLPNPATESYPAQLQKLLGDNYEVMNFGVTGTTLLRDTLSPYSITQACEDALDYCADIAIIELGANDILPSYIDQHQKAFVEDYSVLLEGLRSGNPDMKIYLCSLTPIMGVSGLSDDYLEQWFEFIQLKIREVGSLHGLTVIDITQPLIEAWLEDYKLMPDGVHPDSRGAGLIASKVSSEIERQENSQAIKALFNAEDRFCELLKLFDMIIETDSVKTLLTEDSMRVDVLCEYYDIKLEDSEKSLILDWLQKIKKARRTKVLLGGVLEGRDLFIAELEKHFG